MQIDTDVDESKSILSYMRRCCLCFLCSCCCDGDKDVVRDNARKKRVKEYAPTNAPACKQLQCSRHNPICYSRHHRIRNAHCTFLTA